MGQRVKQVTSQLCMYLDLAIALRGSFSKRSTGRRVNGSTGRRVSGSNRSTGQQVTFTFTILYMIADDARLTSPRCKKHTPYDDTRLTPHHCKKHTASFAHSTGKFPSFWKFTSYCGLKPVWSGMGEVVPARTSLTLHPPSPPTIHQLSRLAL